MAQGPPGYLGSDQASVPQNWVRDHGSGLGEHRSSPSYNPFLQGPFGSRWLPGIREKCQLSQTLGPTLFAASEGVCLTYFQFLAFDQNCSESYGGVGEEAMVTAS